MSEQYISSSPQDEQVDVDADAYYGEPVESWSQHIEKVGNNKKLEEFEKFVNFFKRDAAIKKTLVGLAPTEDDYYDPVSYQDRLYKGFEDISFDLRAIMQDYHQSDELEKRLESIKIGVIHSSGYEELKDTYREDFADMRSSFVDDVKKETVGYYLWRNPYSLDKKAKSINEILHLIHSSIVNNENILQSLPVLASKDDGEVKLYGTEKTDSLVAREIFELIKGVDASSTIDIVSLKDRILMMVRDRGHALTMDIQKDPDGKYYANYFIPKICNVEKVNQLPGVNKVTVEDRDQTKDATTGTFAIGSENVARSVVGFIDTVPTDDDIVRKAMPWDAPRQEG